jgi:hypothetical protein
MGHQPPASRAGLFRPGCERFPQPKRCGKFCLLVVLVNQGVAGLAKCDEILDFVTQACIRIDRHQVVDMQLMLTSS